MLLFCATDAGGARQLVPVIAEAVRKGMPVRVLCSEVTGPVFAATSVPCKTVAVSSEEEALALLKSDVDALVLGTTGTVKTERYCTRAARKRGIRTVTVLDEWYSYALRFRDEKGAVGRDLPDVICAQDELSVQLAVSEGLPADKLRVTGSPALAEVAARAAVFAGSPPERPHVLGTGKQTILLLSQPLRAAYGGEPGTRGTYGEYLGFDEERVRGDLAAVLQERASDVRVIERLHPAEGSKRPPAAAGLLAWDIDAGDAALWPLLWHADVIVGMVSMALLEAAMLGRTPLSYQPDARWPELCTAVRLGVADLQTTKAGLERRLSRLLGEPSVRGDPVRLPCARPDAAERVLEAATAN